MNTKPSKSPALKQLRHAQKAIKKSIQKNQGRGRGHLARKAGNARKAYLREELPAAEIVEEDTTEYWNLQLEVSND